MAAKQYYIDYHKDLQPERVRSLLDTYIPDNFTQDKKSRDMWIHLIAKHHEAVRNIWQHFAVFCNALYKFLFLVI